MSRVDRGGRSTVGEEVGLLCCLVDDLEKKSSCSPLGTLTKLTAAYHVGEVEWRSVGTQFTALHILITMKKNPNIYSILITMKKNSNELLPPESLDQPTSMATLLQYVVCTFVQTVVALNDGPTVLFCLCSSGRTELGDPIGWSGTWFVMAHLECFSPCSVAPFYGGL